MVTYRVIKGFTANSYYYKIGCTVNEFEFSLPVLRALESSGRLKVIETTMHVPSNTTHLRTVTREDKDDRE